MHSTRHWKTATHEWEIESGHSHCNRKLLGQFRQELMVAHLCLELGEKWMELKCFIGRILGFTN